MTGSSIPFTDNSNYMIGPRIMHNGTIYAPKGDFILIFTFFGNGHIYGFGVKSDYSVVQISDYLTYMNFDVWKSFLPRYYYLQDAGIYFYMYGEGDNLHFGIVKQDGSVSDSTFSEYKDFNCERNTGYFFYDPNDSKYKCCFLGSHWTYKAGDQLAMGVFSFSIENDVCKNFSFTEKILDTTYFSHSIFATPDIRRCELSNGKKRILLLWFLARTVMA